MSLFESLFGRIRLPKQQPMWTSWPDGRALEIARESVATRAQLVDAEAILDQVERSLETGVKPEAVLRFVRSMRAQNAEFYRGKR